MSESDPNGWVELHRNYHFLDNGNIIWLSEKSGWHHIYIHNSEGKLVKQLTSGKWEVKNISHIDKKNRKIYFISNKESVFENRFY